MLKLQSITNDPINRIATIHFCDVLDERPRISVAMTIPTQDSQTQAEVLRAVKAMAEAILREACRLCA